MGLKFPKEIPISDTEKYTVFLDEFDCNIDFLEQLSELSFYNGITTIFLTDKNVYFLDESLLNASVRTLKSIKLCCSIGNFADANTLMRKLRDDLILYIFILAVVNNRKAFKDEDLNGVADEEDKLDIDKFSNAIGKLRLNVLNDNEKAVEAWLSGGVNDLPNQIKKKLSFENYMKYLRQNSLIGEILLNYKLESYWERLRRRLNDYVHNNGKQFTKQNLMTSTSEALETHLNNINVRVSYISSFFLVLLLMVDAKKVSSTDLIDHLECDIEPPEGCQYLIASFVQEFIDTKVTKLHPELKQYLKDNNNHGMKID